MKTLFPFREEEALNFYLTNYRKEGLPQLEISKPLDILSHKPQKHDFDIELTWKDPWPHANRAGVYLVYDENAELIYIGTATVIGNRLYTYFGGGSECVYREQWGTPPRYIRIIAVPAEMPFEAQALEAFLIARLKPKHNTRGV